MAVRLLVRLVLAAGMLMAGALAPAISAAPAYAKPVEAPQVTGIGIRLVDVPTATADDPRTRSYITDHLRPGATIQRRVEVVNGTGNRARVSVYAGAATVDGRGFVGAPGRTRNDTAAWTTITPRTLVMAPQERSLVKVTVHVPPRAVRGETYGVVWAQTTTPPKTVSGVTQISRVGIRLYLSIGPGGAPPTDFRIVSLTAARDSAGRPNVQTAVRNTGERALDLTGTLTLSKGPSGLSAGPFPIPAGTTLGIGATEALQVALNQQLPNGPWRATVSVTSGTTTRTAQAELTFPSQPGTGPAITADDNSALKWWLLGAALILILVVLSGLTIYLFRRRRTATASQMAAIGASNDQEQP